MDERQLSERERRFCEAYIGGESGAQAARSAGYSSRSAKEQAARLLTKDNIKEHLQTISGEMHRDRVASAEEALAAVTEILRGNMTNNRDRLKAAEMILRASCGIAHTGGGELDIVDEAQEDEEGLEIALPYCYRDCVEASGIKIDGKIIPFPNCEDEELIIYIMPEDFFRYQVFRATNGEIDIADFPEEKQAEIIKKYKNGELTHSGK